MAPGRFGIRHLVILIGAALILALLKQASGLEPFGRGWCLTFTAIAVAWAAIPGVRASIRPGKVRDRTCSILKWLPVPLVLAVFLNPRPLDLDRDLGLTGPFCFLFGFVPAMMLWTVLGLPAHRGRR